jgi:hypothetical protein
MPPLNSALLRPGIIRIIQYGHGKRVPFGRCGLCERNRPLVGRDLCSYCHRLCRYDGALDEYGYTKDDALADYILLRSAGVSIAECARRMAGVVTLRTLQRYEAELAAAGRAPWRATDENILRRHGGL